MIVDFCPETKTCINYEWCSICTDKIKVSLCPCAQCILKVCCSEECLGRKILFTRGVAEYKNFEELYIMKDGD